MPTRVSDEPKFGSFALVTYISGPLGTFLHSLRHALPGAEKPQAHITVLPPRPLRALVDPVSREAQSILSRFQPFSVSLSEVRMFPETNILYLNISDGNDTLHKLHDALNVDSLAHDECFDFLPHLTISGPIPRREIQKVSKQASQLWETHKGERTFEVNEVVALWQPLYTSPDDWNRVWAHKLGDSGNSATAGSRS